MHEYLSINQKIQVSKDGNTWFNSSIQDLKANTFSITAPSPEEHSLAVSKGDLVRVRFFMSDSSYQFEAYVIDEVKDNISLIQLTYPEQITRIQQRTHVRLPVLLDVDYSISKKDAGAGNKQKFIKASALEISGAGMKLAVRQPVEKKEIMLLKFSLPLKSKTEKLELIARVIRCTIIDDKIEVYHLGLKFIGISRYQQDIIVKFVFERMAIQKLLL